MTTRILIVEDEPVIALDIRTRLNRLGYEVVGMVDTAALALEQVASEMPDLVLMDIRLNGGGDGIEAAMQIRDRFNLPVIFVTAHADEHTLEQAKRARPFGYIVKPFESRDLSAAIEVALSRYQAEVAIQAALTKEKQLHELKSNFIAIVSHEFRNPLTSIQFALDLLERRELFLTEDQKHLYFQRARSCVEQMKELLEDVLMLEEGESGKVLCQPAPMDLLAFCHKLIEEFQPHLSEKHVLTFAVSGVSSEELPICEFDDRLLRHILSNLLSNAIKYSPRGGEVHLEVAFAPEDVHFIVRDQGIGIPATDQAQLFTSFHRGGNVRSIQGTGLGLSIVRQCVEAHGGRIQMESEVGCGSRFMVSFGLDVCHRHPPANQL